MTEGLIIVESPAKARTLKRFLGDRFDVRASMGHVRDLPGKEMGVEVDDGFKPHYEVVESRRKTINELRSAVKGDGGQVILASDPDREGEAIAWHLAEVLKLRDPKRIEFHEITADAVRHALETPRDIDMKLVNAQQARRVVDRAMLHLIKGWLKAPVEERDERGRRRMSGGKGSTRGTPQGGVASPLLANIYMHRYLRAWRQRGKGHQYQARVIAYADDGARPKPLLLRDERSPHHKYPKSVSSLGPGATGQPVPSKQDRHNVLEGSAMCGVVRSPGTETNLQAAIAMNDRCAPVSVYPAVIAARAGTGVAEPPVVGRRLLSMVDELGMRTHRGSRGEGGSMQGQSRGVRLETPPGPPMLAVETEDIRPEAEVPTEAWVGSRRGSYERRRRVMPLEQRAPTSVTLAREGRTA